MSGMDGSRPIIRPPGLQRSSALNNDDDMDYGLPASNLNWAPSTYYSRRTRESVLMKDFLFESPATQQPATNANLKEQLQRAKPMIKKQ